MTCVRKSDLELTRKQKQAKVVIQVEMYYHAFILGMGDLEPSVAIADIEKIIANPGPFMDQLGERCKSDKPHIGRRAARKFLDDCDYLSNEPERIYIFCRDVLENIEEFKVKEKL